MTKYKVIKRYMFPDGEEAVVGFEFERDRKTAYMDWLLAKGYIQEIPPTPATPRLKGMPAMDGYISTVCPYGMGSQGKTNLGVIQNYPTHAAAEEAAAWHRARTNLIRAAHAISRGTNGYIRGEQNNYYAYIDSNGVMTHSGGIYCFLSAESFLHFRTEAQARQFAEECKDDLMVYFGV